MKKFGKVLIVGMVMFLLAAGSVFSVDLEDLQKTVSGFSENMAKSLPFNSTMGLNWSDAYIGQFIKLPPGIPGLGVGLSFGVTFLDIGDMNKILGIFGGGNSIDVSGLGLPLPGYTFEGRLGGFILPFDIGFKFGALPEAIPLLERFDIGLDYMLIGGDIRYSVIPDKVPVIKASVGLGVNHLSGGVSKIIKEEQIFRIGDDYTLAVGNPTVGLRWKTTSVELKAQTSVKLPLVPIIPYLGAGFNFAKSNAGYAIDSKITMTGSDGSVDSKDMLSKLKEFGFTDIAISDKGIESLLDNTAWNMRLFGGFSLKMAVIHLDLTGMYNVFTQNYGMTFGIRLQL